METYPASVRQRLTIRPALSSDLEAILDLLMPQEFVKPLTRERLRASIDYPWRRPQQKLGLVVVNEEGTIGGFLGVIYSPARQVHGRTFRTAGLAHMFIGRGFQSEKGWDGSTRTLRRISVEMVREIQAEPVVSLSLTAHGPLDIAARTLDAIGFQHWSEQEILTTWWGARDTWRSSTGRVLTGGAMLPHLTSEEQQIVSDHAACGCSALVVVERDRPCLIITKRKTRRAAVLWPRLPKGRSRRMPVSQVLHVSDPGIAVRNWSRVVATLNRCERTIAVACPEAFVDGMLAGRRVREVLRWHGPRPHSLRPDMLYTEVPLLP